MHPRLASYPYSPLWFRSFLPVSLREELHKAQRNRLFSPLPASISPKKVWWLSLSSDNQSMILFRIAYMINPAIVFAPIFVFIFCRIVSIVRVLRKTSLEISSVVLSSARSLRMRISFSENFDRAGVELADLPLRLQL